MDVNWDFTASNYEEFTAQKLSQGKRVMGSTCFVFKQTNPWLYWLPEVRYFCVKNQLKIVLVWVQSYHLRVESKNQTESNRYTHKQDTYDVPSTDMPPEVTSTGLRDSLFFLFLLLSLFMPLVMLSLSCPPPKKILLPQAWLNRATQGLNLSWFSSVCPVAGHHVIFAMLIHLLTTLPCKQPTNTPRRKCKATNHLCYRIKGRKVRGPHSPRRSAEVTPTFGRAGSAW